MTNPNDIVIVDAVRTAVGNFNGGLASFSGAQLGAEVIKVANNGTNTNPEFSLARYIGGPAATPAEICPGATRWRRRGRWSDGELWKCGDGSSMPVTFTITNPGTEELNSLAIIKEGANATEFTVSSLGATSLANGPGTMTFTVTLTPTSIGAKTVALRLFNNVIGAKSPYDLPLTGTAVPPAPTVAGIDPSIGTTSGGTPVTITGTNFLAGAAVTIGGAAAANVNVVNATTITATTPAHAGSSAQSAQAAHKGSFAMVAHLAVDGVAEIVAATPDGMTLLYTSADLGRLGLIDIANPAKPVLLPPVDVRLGGVGEPTSVAVTPDGRYAGVAVRLDDDVDNPRRGLLRVYDIRNAQAVRHALDVTVGIGPDSLALVGAGRTLRAVVAIEDEETDAKGDATLGGKRPGQIDVVDLQALYGGHTTGVQTIRLVDALKALPDAIYPDDPQPEFVSIQHATQQAVVSLQENNAIAILDLSNPRQAQLVRMLSAARQRGAPGQRRSGQRPRNCPDRQRHLEPRARCRGLGGPRRVCHGQRGRRQKGQRRQPARRTRIHAVRHPGPGGV